MAYKFENLPQLVDKREGLRENGEYSKRVMAIRTRVWHHSLTKKHLGGSDAASFADYHVNTLGWPGVGYAFVIEPKNVVNTPKGKRARIVYCHDINRRTYHVGSSNQFALGICVAGDYRYDQLDDATKASIDELQEALVADRIGNEDKAHQEMPGYGWKPCCEFNYMEAFKFLDGNVKQEALPNTYTIQEGDTLWGIANGIDGLTVDDLLEANPGIKPASLKIGQKINLGAAKKSTTSNKSKPKSNLAVDGYWGPATTRALQKALGTTQDGVISGQYNNATTRQIENVSFGTGGSLVIKALQRKIGAKADGYIGPATVRAMQRRFGTPQDGVISKPSMMVKELQRRLNAGKL